MIDTDAGVKVSGGYFDTDPPTLLLHPESVEAVRWLAGQFMILANSEPGRSIRLDLEEAVSLEGVRAFELWVSDKYLARNVVSDGHGGFRWGCAPDEWVTMCLFLEPFLDGRPGFQYLRTPTGRDDVVVQVSFGLNPPHVG